MEKINRLIDLLTQLIDKQLQPASTMEIIVQYWVPIITALLLISSAIAGVYKYYKTKNTEIYEKILKEVYTPLYSYFVKQEIYRKIHKLKPAADSAPILEITTSKTTVRATGVEKILTPFCKLNRDEIIKVLESVNTGLASKELVTLLNMYLVVVEMERSYGQDTNEYLEATILKVEIEKALRKEIIQGFKMYYKKLGLKSVAKSGLWALKDDNILFPYEVSEDDKLILKAELEAEPEKYQR